MRRRIGWALLMAAMMAAAAFVACSEEEGDAVRVDGPSDVAPAEQASGEPVLLPNGAGRFPYLTALAREGQRIFRDDTFKSETFWGDVLRLHDAIKGRALGGVGAGLSPAEALALGIKVDVTAVPPDVAAAAQAGTLDLDDPKNTLALLKADAVIGIKGVFEGNDLVGVGITCAICHATTDDSFAAGIGRPLDGWANRDLDIGTIISLAPNLQVVADRLGVDVATLRTVLQGWGPGKFDAQVLHDGRALRPDGKPAATLIPPAFGMAGQNLHTWTGWGSIPYWNAYVANTQMRGLGTFYDPRLNDPEKYPIAVATGEWNKRDDEDAITSKLAPLHIYQLSLAAPSPPAGSFDPKAAMRGSRLFNGRARCATCHVPPLYTEPGWAMHTAEEMGIDDFQASRSPDERYATRRLGGLWSHQKGGFYHDGRFATLREVIDHYDELLDLGLSEGDKADLEQFLLSLGDPLEKKKK